MAALTQLQPTRHANTTAVVHEDVHIVASPTFYHQRRDDFRDTKDVSSTKTDEDGLCALCSEINFDVLESPAPRFGAVLAIFNRPWKPHDQCVLCSLFSWLLEDHEDVSREESFTLLYGQVLPHPRVEPVMITPGKTQHSLRDGIFVVKPGIPRGWWMGSRNTRYIAVTPGSASISTPWNRLQHIDYQAIRHTIDRMRASSARNVDQSPTSLRVIDCLSLQIVSLPLGHQYVALSYVWGSYGTSNKDTFDIRQAPATIQDAISAAQELGYRYLWVDRYCIDQSDHAQKHSIIQQMGKVYNGASVTFIAAAGSNPQHGLPGVRTRGRSLHVEVCLKGSYQLSLCGRPGPSIENSVWMTRGWTYQEALLSSTRCFFTDDQLCRLPKFNYLLQSSCR